ncbi:hypothetical protein ACJW30_05G071500 [Castanea mollissima]
MKSHIPIDLIAHILCRLPVKSVLRFLCVSKSWAELIKGLGFIKTHLKRSINSDRDCTIIIDQIASVPSLNFLSVLFRHDNENCLPRAMEIYPPLQGRPKRETTIVDYCNGLVCLHNNVKEIALWNPLIRKYKKLPSEPVQRPSGFEDSLWSTEYAFGHDPHNNDYKVVRIAQFCEGHRPLLIIGIEVKIYSLILQAWKKVEEPGPNKLPWISSSPAVSTNGAAHWFTIPDRSVPGQEILAFDFANNEKFLFYKTPVQPIDTDDIQKTGLGVLGGCLCFVVNDCKNMCHEVWLMKEYGVENSWTKVYKIDLRANKISSNSNFEFFKPLKFSRDRKKVLLENSGNLFWYDLEKERSKRLKVQNLPVLFRPLTSTGSLLLLDDGDSVTDPKQNKIKKSR